MNLLGGMEVVVVNEHVPKGKVFIHDGHAMVGKFDYAQIETRIMAAKIEADRLAEPLPFMEMDDYDDAVEYGERSFEEVMAGALWKKVAQVHDEVTYLVGPLTTATGRTLDKLGELHAGHLAASHVFSIGYTESAMRS